MTRLVAIALTATQAEVLLVAVGAIGDDLGYYGLSGPQKRAYPSLMEQVKRAYRESHE
jgi:hypothetical protein